MLSCPFFIRQADIHERGNSEAVKRSAGFYNMSDEAAVPFSLYENLADQ